MDKFPALFENPEGESVIKIITKLDVIKEEQSKLRAKLRDEGKPETWIDIGVLVDDPYFLVIRDLVEFPGGFRSGYIRFINRKSLEGGTGSVIIPVYQGQICLQRHFRHALRDWMWEIPRGFGEIGLSGFENAKKELREELGLVPSRLIPLGSGSPDFGASDDNAQFFLAEIEEVTENIPTEGYHEGISDRILVSVEEFERMIVKGEMQDSFSILAYTMAKIKGLLCESEVSP